MFLSLLLDYFLHPLPPTFRVPLDHVLLKLPLGVLWFGIPCKQESLQNLQSRHMAVGYWGTSSRYLRRKLAIVEGDSSREAQRDLGGNIGNLTCN